MELKDLLETQDMGQRGVNRICNEKNRGTFDYEKDPISGIVIKLFEDNKDGDLSSMVTDLNYTISQLTKVKKKLEEEINK